ncbi:hypothetical protein [Rheinheimera salexigens]|uniref:Uncharacterized protein n=1 Tax=Rheinheimera salexigens TaxID=1628148 RepID=A0A1E7Q4I9_9GAMM|nr:hypothetical protein [Rheinheimera salexigens]OEY69056.1 hypothetical protein BI198_05325 [Rheinheimera salexigens]
MVSIIASSMLLGQLMLNQPLVVDLEQQHHFQKPVGQSQLLACTWFPLCTDPDIYTSPERNKDKTDTSSDKKSDKLA